MPCHASPARDTAGCPSEGRGAALESGQLPTVPGPRGRRQAHRRRRIDQHDPGRHRQERAERQVLHASPQTAAPSARLPAPRPPARPARSSTGPAAGPSMAPMATASFTSPSPMPSRRNSNWLKPRMSANTARPSSPPTRNRSGSEAVTPATGTRSATTAGLAPPRARAAQHAAATPAATNWSGMIM